MLNIWKRPINGRKETSRMIASKVRFFCKTLKVENSPSSISIVHQYDSQENTTPVAVLGTKTGWILDIGNSPFAFTTSCWFFFPFIRRAAGHSLEANRDVFRTSCNRNTPWQHVYNNMFWVQLSVPYLRLFGGGHIFMPIHCLEPV